MSTVQHEKDQWNNSYLSFSQSPELIDLQSAIQQKCDPTKAIILRGLTGDVASAYNVDQTDSKRRAIHQGNGVFLIKNNSNCPETYQGKLYAAGVSYLVQWTGKYYALMIKDTKTVITNIGGTFDSLRDTVRSDDRDDPTELFRQIMKREFQEEVAGMVRLHETNGSKDVKVVSIVQVELDDQLPVHLATVNYVTPLFGSTFPDSYRTFRYFVNLDEEQHNTTSNSNSWLHLLFDPSNLDSHGNYTLQYVDHEETQYIHATPLNPEFKFSIGRSDPWNDLARLMDGLFNIVPTFAVYSQQQGQGQAQPRVSLQHLMVNYLHLSILLNRQPNVQTTIFIDQTHVEFKKIKMPPSTVYLELFIEFIE